MMVKLNLKLGLSRISGACGCIGERRGGFVPRAAHGEAVTFRLSVCERSVGQAPASREYGGACIVIRPPSILAGRSLPNHVANGAILGRDAAWSSHSDLRTPPDFSRSVNANLRDQRPVGPPRNSLASARQPVAKAGSSSARTRSSSPEPRSINKNACISFSLHFKGFGHRNAG